MNQLTKPKSTIDFKVNQITGEAFISIRKTAELLNINKESIRDFLAKPPHNYDTKQGLTPEMLQQTATHYALFSRAVTEEAKLLLGKLAEAGAKAFIYHGAGLDVDCDIYILE